MCLPLHFRPHISIPVPEQWNNFSPEINTTSVLLGPLVSNLEITHTSNLTYVKFSDTIDTTNSQCIRWVTPPTQIVSLPSEIFFFCGTSAYHCLNGSSESMCFLSFLVPPMTIYTEQDLYKYVVTKPCNKRVPILPFVIRAGVLGRLGIGIDSTTTSTQFYYKLSQELNGNMERVTNSLVTLQDQLNSLAAVGLQNQRALDLLTAERGGTCLFLGEECCYYVNQSGIITKKVKEIRDRIQRRAEELQNTEPWGLLSQWMPWILPLGPLAAVILLLLFGPCIFNLLAKFASSRIEAVKLYVVLQMEPQMQSMTKIYCGSLDQPASPGFNVNDIEGTPPEEISTAQSLLCPSSAGRS
nr:syncytin-1 [Macaca nemestrina]